MGRVLARKARSLLRLPPFVLAWLLPLWLLLGLARALILTLSFRRLAPWLGHSVGIAARVPLLDAAQERRARHIAQAVELAARYTPWDSNCFARAVAARLLLGLHGLPWALCLGLARDPASAAVQAHAWVAAGRVRVSGGGGFDRYTVVGCFVAPSLARA